MDTKEDIKTSRIANRLYWNKQVKFCIDLLRDSRRRGEEDDKNVLREIRTLMMFRALHRYFKALDEEGK